jgi:thymidylate synthase (FAD)
MDQNSVVNGVSVTLEDVMGDDLTPILSAKVSFDKDKDEEGVEEWENISVDNVSRRQPVLKERHINLLNYLARGMSGSEFNLLVDSLVGCTDKDLITKALWAFRRTPTHAAPFGSCFVRFTVEAPIFVARQLVKHEYLRMSEVSRRYVKGQPSYFIPSNFSGIAANVKQGSGELLDEATDAVVQGLVGDVVRGADEAYDQLLSYVSPEEARMVLPLNTMTRWKWSGSLDAFANMCNLRLDPHTQSLTRGVAEQISDKMSWVFPESWKALVGNG